ncbi:MAG: hypothetical protein OEW35_09010 [Gammaproteobacteria bacterium]|nr:hypothetical protein [Gammaproteobacteria bacterium]MDH4253602.1 hypothetical protein [Gammaproteobacteria bacterium]MDH5310365.1 hypothetical protein [Gammaproteobacteria bacterium]
MIQTIVQNIEGSPVNDWILSSSWLWPLLEIIHFIGLSLLLGAMLVVDLRLAGYLRSLNLVSTHRLLPWATVGFALNLVTGALFFLGDPGRYAINIGFQIKMVLVLIAGLNALCFLLAVRPKLAGWDPYGDTPPLAKGVAWLSLAAWFAVLLLGRLIPYIGTG